MNEQDCYTIDEAQLLFAKRTNGRVWELLDKPTRTQAEDEEMLHAAHASLYHWLHAGTAVHHQRGLWMIARVHVVLNNPAEALRYANRCLELTEQHRDLMVDFDIAFAYESIARASALAGKRQQARRYHQLAEQAGRTIVDQEDRDIFIADLLSANLVFNIGRET